MSISTLPSDSLKKCACKSSQNQNEQAESKEKNKTEDIMPSVTFTDQEVECICSIDDTDELIIAEEEEYVSSEGTFTPVPYCETDLMMGPLLTVKTVDSQTCACKEAILKRIDESLCYCERCEDDRRRKNSILKYIIDNTKETENKPVPVIRDCKATPICTCMEKYKKQWEQFERTRGIRKVQEALKSLEEKFVINGTAVGPDGKIVYILSSVMPQRCCQCARIKEIEEEEKRTLKQMPMLPGGCIKYHIAGVQERPEGNVYVLAGTTENVECDCMALYERFTREHTLCLKLFNAYMKKIAYDTEEYLKEVNSQYGDFTASATWSENRSEVEVIDKSCTCHCDRATQMCCVCNTNTEDSVDCICSVKSCPCGFEECECVTEGEGGAIDESLYECGGECDCTLSSEGSEGAEGLLLSNCACSSLTNKDNIVKVVKKISEDLEVKKEKDDFDLLLERIKEEYKKHPLYKVEDPPELERYMIFKKLPATHREQTEVLKVFSSKKN